MLLKMNLNKLANLIGILANVNSQKQKILILLCYTFSEDQNALVYIGKWSCLLPESIG